MNDDLSPPDGPRGFPKGILVAGAIALIVAWVLRLVITPDSSAQIGKPFPPIEAGGWINEPGPSPEDLKGQILVVDAWAFWCIPCQAIAPYLIDLHDRYQSKGVKFLGLTSEGGDRKGLEMSRMFVDKLKIPWPNAYLAIEPLKALEVEAIPQLWIVDRDNRIIFHEVGFHQGSIASMEKVLDEALSRTP
ncbi:MULTISPECIES: TlpA family protein disulfide reductase [unclassified Schlesneria]|uniref:TlpA family protein disulfide reductase n=1 Tax=unclassified Schlesneria TaxID=2762017 RepID=UPI002F018670